MGRSAEGKRDGGKGSRGRGVKRSKTASHSKKARMAFSARLHGHGVLGILHSIENSLLTNINKRIDKESIDSVLTSIEQARRALVSGLIRHRRFLMAESKLKGHS